MPSPGDVTDSRVESGDDRAPTPYGAVDDLAQDGRAPEAPAGRRRGRRWVGADGDLEIRPALDTIGYGAVVCVVFGIGMFARSGTTVATAVFVAAGVLAWLWQSVYVLTSRVRVVRDVLEVRVPGGRRVVSLSDLDAPLLVKVARWNSLQLRTQGGRRFARLHAAQWGDATLTLLGERLGATSQAAGTGNTAEQELPRWLEWMVRHQGPLAVALVVGLLVVAGVVAALVG
ncbi:hypothetical protein [Pseudactinotalea sp.]|uniref:hypothetical protein n=1 Tax=Pseudactinotalea sp. TaxID=1926260 RepID=UPI003B3BB857